MRKRTTQMNICTFTSQIMNVCVSQTQQLDHVDCNAKVVRSDWPVRMRRLVRAQVLRLCHEVHVRFSSLWFIGKDFGSVFTFGEAI